MNLCNGLNLEVCVALIQVLAPREQTTIQAWLKDALIVFGASILIALFAPIAFKLPFSPVAIVTQPHVILFLAVFLGRKRATAAVISYLTYGALGLPVFAMGGAGIAWLLGPTGGYLIGYIFAAYLTGYLCERAKERTLLTTLSALVAGNMVIFFTGVIWLSQYVGGIQPAILLGVLPFLPGDALKIVLVLKALKN